MTRDNKEQSNYIGILKRSHHNFSLSSKSIYNKEKYILDKVVHEEPLQVKINNKVFSVTMRTPGNDNILAIGFLFSEGIITHFSDILNIYDSYDSEIDSNIINVILNEKKSNLSNLDLLSKRGTIISASCGVCGRQSIDDILNICNTQSIYPTIKKNIIQESVNVLRDNQSIFSETGGCHGAASITYDGKLISVFEDIGRHNAVDKVIGSLVKNNLINKLNKNLKKSASLLAVSGRLSFEIAQKCAVASIPVISSVSAPSSLAVDLAHELGITIASFVRDKGFNIYTHKERII